MKRQVFEDYQPYKIKHKARFDLGNNENRIIDWSFLPQKTLESLEVGQLSFYGDNTYSELIEKYAAYLGVNPKQVTVGVGSDHLIHMIVSTFMEKDDTFLTVNPDFFMYETYNQMHGSRFEAIDLEEKDGTLFLPVENLLARAQETNAKILMISNPNNPSSVAYSMEDLESLRLLSRDCWLLTRPILNLRKLKVSSVALKDMRMFWSCVHFPRLLV